MDEGRRAHGTRAADIGEPRRINADARAPDNRLDVPGAAGNRERETVARDAPVEVIERYDSGRALHVLHHDVRVPRNEAAEMARDGAGAGVDAATRRIADDHGDGLTLVEIGRKRGRREDEREAANKPPQRMKNMFGHAASLAKRPAALARGVASQSCGHTTTVPIQSAERRSVCGAKPERKCSC